MHKLGPAHSAITHGAWFPPSSPVKLPSNSPRWVNRRCYMWTGCQNDFVISPSLRCLKMLTHCVWGTNVLLEVMEAFSLFFCFFQTAFICLSVHSSVRNSISPATDVSWHFLPTHDFLSGHLIQTLLWIYRLYNFIWNLFLFTSYEVVFFFCILWYLSVF